jgi:hypothetical protein
MQVFIIGNYINTCSEISQEGVVKLYSFNAMGCYNAQKT